MWHKCRKMKPFSISMQTTHQDDIGVQTEKTCKGRSINKLQNSIILLVFQILKIRNIHFVRNLILSSSCEFYDDDVTVTLFINIK